MVEIRGEASPDVSLPNIGPVRFHLHIQHVEYSDFVRMRRLLIAQAVCKSRLKNFVLGFIPGLVFSFLIILAFYYLRSLIFSGVSLFIIGFILGRAYCVYLTRKILRRIYEAVYRDPSDRTIAVGDDGVQFHGQGCTLICPWNSFSELRQEATASFLIMKSRVDGATIPHAAFTDATERTACLAFIQERLVGV